MSTGSVKYNPAIDGLRAISVLAVVGYHAGFGFLSGGFLGVDVFFVISGYLISGHLIREVERTGTISPLSFIAKRMRRLLPSFFLVLIVSAIFSLLIMTPDEFKLFGRSWRSAAFAVSNVFFLNNTGGYFDVSTDLAPLLHTWSLSVEEQFYLGWPFLIIGCGLFSRKATIPLGRVVFAVVCVVGLASLLFCLYFSYKSQPVAFYLMPARAWEFSVGALAGQWAGTSGATIRRMNFLGGASLLLLVLSIIFISSEMTFPGVVVIAPVLSATGIIFVLHADADKQSYVYRLLSWKPLVLIGLMSYTLYLVHWPILSLTRNYFLGERSLYRDTVCVFIAVIVSALQFKFYERPLRAYAKGWFLSARRTVLAGCTGVVSVGVLAQASVVSGPSLVDWVTSSVGTSSVKQVLPSRFSLPNGSDKCFQSATADPLPINKCLFGEGGELPEVLLWGDSHALMATSALMGVNNQVNARFLLRSAGGCPPVPGVVKVDRSGLHSDCDYFNQSILRETLSLANQGLKAVVLVARWSYCMGGASLNPAETDICSISLQSADLHAGDGVGGFLADQGMSEKALSAAMDNMVGLLDKAGLKVVIFSPLPEMRNSVEKCLRRHNAVDCKISRAVIEARRAGVLKAFLPLTEKYSNVVIFDPINEFCDDRYCYGVRDGVLNFWDDNHMTADKGYMISQSLYPKISWALGK